MTTPGPFRFPHDDDPDHIGPDDERWVGLKPESFMELTETMLVAGIVDVEDNTDPHRVSLPQAVMILWAAAQPEAFEVVHDIRPDVMLKLDWTDDEKAYLLSVSVVQIYYGCELRATDPEHAEHVIPLAQIVRIQKSPEAPEGWHWTEVRSDYDLDAVIVECANQIGDGETRSAILVAGTRPFQSTVRAQFAKLTQQANIETEMASFVAELDALFPSAPSTKEGGSDADPRPGS